MCFDPSIQGKIELLSVRTGSAAARCSILIEEAKRVLGTVLSKANQCETTGCANRAINGLLSSLSNDLRAAHLGRPCNAIAAELRSISDEENKEKEEEERQNALRTYLACAKAAVSVTDDLSSGADMVAIAAHSKCNGAFAHATRGLSTKATTAIENQLRPKLIEFVLDWRRKVRQAPTQPRYPEQSPDKFKRIM